MKILAIWLVCGIIGDVEDNIQDQLKELINDHADNQPIRGRLNPRYKHDDKWLMH